MNIINKIGTVAILTLALTANAEAKGKSRPWYTPIRIDTSRITVIFVGLYVPERNKIQKYQKRKSKRSKRQ